MLEAVLVDDASVDDTEQVVRRTFPAVSVISGTGALYWAGGMAHAENTAMTLNADYLLWLNDDVTLNQDALAHLLSTERQVGAGRCIVVGAVRDPESGELTYSGLRRQGRGLHPLRVEMVHPTGGVEPVEMFHGNVVLVSIRAAMAVGPIDGGFSHAQADLDYGLRARNVGIQGVLAPKSVGTCRRNRSSSPWLDPSLPAARRLQILFGRKGLPPRSAARYLRRHGGFLWPVFWVAPYVRATVSLIRRPRATRPGESSHRS